MNSLPFSQLTDRQRAQVTYLFADEIFGTDASAYAYEVDDNGEVKGRALTKDEGQQQTKDKGPKTRTVKVHMKEEAHITDEQIVHARMSMDALAAFIASDLYQTQSQEVESL